MFQRAIIQARMSHEDKNVIGMELAYARVVSNKS